MPTKKLSGDKVMLEWIRTRRQLMRKVMRKVKGAVLVVDGVRHLGRIVLRTPRGKLITIHRYCALVEAQNGLGRASRCPGGHVSCAGWGGGPCSAALAAEFPYEGRTEDP